MPFSLCIKSPRILTLGVDHRSPIFSPLEVRWGKVYSTERDYKANVQVDFSLWVRYFPDFDPLKVRNNYQSDIKLSKRKLCSNLNFFKVWLLTLVLFKWLTGLLQEVSLFGRSLPNCEHLWIHGFSVKISLEYGDGGFRVFGWTFPMFCFFEVWLTRYCQIGSANTSWSICNFLNTE